MSQETSITIQLVHGGYVLHTPVTDETASATSFQSKTEVFTSHGKLMKAIRGAIDEFSLVAKKASDSEE